MPQAELIDITGKKFHKLTVPDLPIWEIGGVVIGNASVNVVK